MRTDNRTLDEKIAERGAKLDALQAKLTDAVEQLVTGEDWRHAMEFAARFRARSFNNTLLIWVQHAVAYAEGRVPDPTPTYVAGFKQWQSLGRQMVAHQYGAVTECSNREKEALEQLRPPAGASIELDGDMENGRFAHSDTQMQSAAVIAHYAQQLRANGWSIRHQQQEYLEADHDGLRIVLDTSPVRGCPVTISIFEPSDR